MHKKLMHITIDDMISVEDTEKIYKSLSKLEDTYDIVITNTKVHISTYNQELIENINDKLDIVIANIDKVGNIRNDITNDIKYVFGIKDNNL